MEKERSLEYRFVLSPADFSAAYARAGKQRRSDALSRLCRFFLVGIPLVLATNFVDHTGALAGLLGVVGMMVIIAGVTSNLSQIFARNEKVPSFEHQPTLIQVRPSGVSKSIAGAEVNLGWTSVEHVALGEFGIGFATNQGDWLIPVRTFGTEAAMKAEYEKILWVMRSGDLVDDIDSSVPHTLH